ncbi:PepSY-like domain-containing protein [Fulvivirga sediminis]|uniref:PepSY-like domain-containing protein n=1 Tax=Fulvivirga sediminis TaxID=2803949 RepID=A0A937F7L4_9BACT|nr:PepSY-like domain-containing protein [Fulvivirga sediminis]MBL3655800.1 PepSY-like domain-containing protein [Fulvivirga sediminis]
MKNLMMMLLASMAMVFMSCDSDDGDDVKPQEVPEEVKTTFNNEFPKAAKVEWEALASIYEVEFEIDAVDYEAQLSSDGILIRYKYEITVNQLPEQVGRAINESYPDKIIDDLDVLVQGGANYYMVDFENSTPDHFVFDEAGKETDSVEYWD